MSIDLYDYHIDFVKSHVNEVDRLTILAEEAAELAQAALKLVRYYNGQTASVDAPNKLVEALEEEVADVKVCLDTLDYEPDHGICRRKAERWRDRWNIEHSGEVNP